MKTKPGIKSKCKTKYCRNEAKQNGICWKCHRERKKKKNIYAYTLGTLRRNAKRRGIECTLTVDEWKKFCIETGILERRGRTKNCESVDRKQEHIGYTYDNICPLSVSQNSLKRHRKIVYVVSTGEYALVEVPPASHTNEEMPF